MGCRLLIACCLLLAAVVLAAPSAGAKRVATAARTCQPPSYPGSGYFTSLSVKRVSCSTGRKLALAYYRCRTKHGPSGRCRSKVMHYRCKEKRNSIPTEIDARVTCTNGARKIVHTYQQNT
jgi:hypothetical protein